MSEKDVIILTQLRVPDGSPISTKPCYLVSLKEKTGTGKVTSSKNFISLDLPNMQPSFVQAKGFYSDSSEEEIFGNFKQLIQEVNKEKIKEKYFPWDSIKEITSLVYRHK